jgi:hypothetical protein
MSLLGKSLENSKKDSKIFALEIKTKILEVRKRIREPYAIELDS